MTTLKTGGERERDERDLKWLQQRRDGMTAREIAIGDRRHSTQTVNHRTHLIRKHDIERSGEKEAVVRAGYW